MLMKIRADRIRSGASTLREVVGLVWSQASGFVKMRLVVSLVLLVSTSVLTALGPLALKHVVDSFTGQNTGDTVSVTLLIALYVMSQWLARCVGEVRGFLYARAERRMFRTLSEQLFAHVMQLPLQYHLERKTGAINQTLENGLRGYQMIVHHLVFTFLPVIAELGTIIVVLLSLKQPVFFALFTGALICYAIAFAVAATRVAQPARMASSSGVDASATMTDSILNYETVKYFAAEPVVQERVSRALLQTENDWIGFHRRYAANGLAVATIYAVFLGVTILYAARQVDAGQMTVGGFVLINTYMLQVVRPVEMLGYAMQGFSQGIAMLEKMLELFHEKPEPRHVNDLANVNGPGSLEFQHVSLSYRSDRAVLKDVSFKVPAGKTLGIVGASGAGKSTIVRLLVRMFEPKAGRILLDEMPVSDVSLAKLRQAVAVVPQDTVLFNDTIGYNIGFGKSGSTQAEIEEAARLAHLHDFIMSLPEKYETRVGERGVKLSGGEKQRVSIARAALKHPRIYVFDEATSSLDSRTEQEILKNLRDISKSSTTLVIAHRLSTVVHADEIVVLDSGRIAERGSHENLLAQNGRYAALWAAQQASSTEEPAKDKGAVVA